MNRSTEAIEAGDPNPPRHFGQGMRHFERSERLPADSRLFGFLMLGMSMTKSAILFEAQLLRCRPLVLRGRVVATLAFRTSQGDKSSHDRTPYIL